MIKSLDDFKNGCIPMHCGARTMNDLTYLTFCLIFFHLLPQIVQICGSFLTTWAIKQWSCFSGPPYMCSAIFAFCMTRDGNETSVFTTSLFTVSLAQERRALPQTSLPVHRPEPRGVHKYSNLLYLVCSRLSQRLYRPSTVYIISGLSDRTFERHGTICDFPNYRQSACQATCLQSWETSLDPLIVCSDVHLFIHL